MAASDPAPPPQRPPALPAPSMMLGMARSYVAMTKFNEQKQDYAENVAIHAEGTPERKLALDACHKRGSARCVEVTKLNRGLYVKAAQFLVAMRGGTGDRAIPQAYADALAAFTDHAPHKSAAEIADVLKEAMVLGMWPKAELDACCDLKSIEDQPVASASLAQVHWAMLRNGEFVAVKVQYPELHKEMVSDFATFKAMGAQIKEMSHGYDLMWIVEDFECSMARELDFELEAENAEHAAAQLAHLLPQVYVPKVFKTHSSKRVLTMEFCDHLIKVTDSAALRGAGLDLQECALLICRVFAEMIFIHGRMHADPHSGNVYFRAVPGMAADSRSLRPQLVLLDHGLYHDLSVGDVRLQFCKYWLACCENDVAAMQTIGPRFAGELCRLLPLILSPWFLPAASASSEDLRAAARGDLPESVSMQDITDFVAAARSGGANFIGLLHSLGYVRSLLKALGMPEEGRLSCMLSYAVLGNTPSPPTVPPVLTSKERARVESIMRQLHRRLFAEKRSRACDIL